MFILYDDFGFLKKLGFLSLKDELRNELKNDILENTDTKDIVKNDLDILEKLVNTHDVEFIRKELEGFGVYFLGDTEIEHSFNILKNYYLQLGKQETEEKHADIEQLEKLVKKMLDCEK